MSSLRKTLQEARDLQRKASRELHPWREDSDPDILPSANDIKRVDPFIDQKGDLVIPMEGSSKYHWWRRGGQSILDTLLELGAGADILDRYVMNWRLKITEEQLN